MAHDFGIGVGGVSIAEGSEGSERKYVLYYQYISYWLLYRHRGVDTYDQYDWQENTTFLVFVDPGRRAVTHEQLIPMPTSHSNLCPSLAQ